MMLVLLVVLIFIYHLGAGIYAALGEESSPAFDFLYDAAFLCGVVWWLKTATKRTALTGIYCPGMLVGIGWFIMIPYHLLKKRGVKGLIPLLALVGSFVFARVLAETVLFVARP